MSSDSGPPEFVPAPEAFERFFTLSLDMLCIAGTDGYFRRVNPAFEVLGYTTEELLGKPFLEFVHPDDRPATLNEVAKLAAGIPTISFENRYRCKDGSYRWLSWTSAPDSAGRLYAVARDVTALKITEESLRAAEREASRSRMFLDAIVENIPHMVFVKDAGTLSFQMMNRAGEELLGRPRSELIGKNDFDFFPPRQAEFFQQKDRETLAGQRAAGIEEPIETRSGQRWLHTRKVPIRDAGGIPRFLLGISEDITERRENEIALREAIQSAEAANRELEAFCYSVAHDLRAPLRGIDGYSQMLVEDYSGTLGDEGRRILGVVRESAVRMSVLIDDLLTLSRVTRASFQPQPVDLTGIVQSTLDRLRRENPSRSVSTAVHPGLIAEGDPRLVTQVIENLVGNAWKFTAKRSEARIEFGALPDGQPPVYFVRDNGAGFDMAYVDKLFGAFQRLHHAEDFEGTGVGLAIVQRIVQRHGGRVWAEARVDAGATFYFTLGAEGSS